MENEELMTMVKTTIMQCLREMSTAAPASEPAAPETNTTPPETVPTTTPADTATETPETVPTTPPALNTTTPPVVDTNPLSAEMADKYVMRPGGIVSRTLQAYGIKED